MSSRKRLKMETSGVLCLVLLCTAVLTVALAKCTSPEYWNRDCQDTLPQTSTVATQSWDDLPKEFHRWYLKCNNEKFKTWLKETANAKFQAWFAQSSLWFRDWFATTQKVTYWNWFVKLPINTRKWYYKFAPRFEKYHSYDEKVDFFEKLERRYGNLLRMETIGRTAIGTKLYAVHITKDVRSVRNRPKVYIQCLIHARDWVSGAVCEYLVAIMAERYTIGNSKLQKILSKVELVIVPVVNPDGYELSRQEGYREWLKNTGSTKPMQLREKLSKEKLMCIGVDLDQNFHRKYNSRPALPGKCSDPYSGQDVQQPEVKAIMNFIHRMGPIYGAIDFHSFGRLVYFPHASTDKRPLHFEELISVASYTAFDMSKDRPTRFYSPVNGETTTRRNFVQGSFLDWAFSDEVASRNEHKLEQKKYRIIPLAIYLSPNFEQRHDAYKIPEGQIKYDCFQAYRGVLEFIKQVLKKPIPYSKQ